MPAISLETFTAFSASHSGLRAIHVRNGADGLEVGAGSFSQRLGRDHKANQRTMAAFKDCLSARYGVFGEHAFDAVLGVRNDLGKRLRAGDVAAVMKALDPANAGVVRQKLVESRFANEVARQAEANPRVLAANVGTDVQRRLMEGFKSDASFSQAVRACTTQTELTRVIERRLNAIMDEATAPGAERPLVADRVPDAPQGGVLVEPDRPMGLGGLDEETFGGHETSVEDRVRAGTFGAGMRVNSTGVRYVFEKLKTNGVEPGFIARRDWSADDTREMMASGTALDAAARTVLARILGRPLAAGDDVVALKAEHFTAIRDAVMSGTGNVTRLTERHIVKLDYNENDRKSRFRHAAGSVGKFRLPIRNKLKFAGPVGSIFRMRRLTTAIDASAGAVGEALANDITRALGVPTQELTLVKGRYSDGKDKIMLVSKFAQGYHDFDGNFLKDGRLVPRMEGGRVVETPGEIGRYKAMFLLLADRDAVGSHGQNKGIVNGRFFAIDPGHSLEGNAEALTIHDDFSFDVEQKIGAKRFLNFSVFDDCNRSEKLAGMIAIRKAFDSGRINEIVAAYTRRFPLQMGAESYELNSAIQNRIDLMYLELVAQYRRMSEVFRDQLDVYDRISGQHDEATALKVVDAVENLERLTSPTTDRSKHGEVELRHLEVVPSTRLPWKARVEGTSVRFSCAAMPDPARRAVFEATLRQAGVADVAGENGGLSFTVSQGDLAAFLAAFTEDAVKTAVKQM